MKYNNEMRFSNRTGLWYKGNCGKGWILKDKCKCCGEKYFTRADKISDYCSYSCARNGKNNPMYGKTHTKKVKEKLSKCLKNTMKKICNQYNISNISCLDEVKRKKGQSILSFEYISNYIKKFNYELLDKDNLNNKHTILKIKCPNNHIFNMSWESFRKGHRCSQCYYDSLCKKYGIDDYNEFMKYRNKVTSLTNKTYRKYKNIINPNNYKRGKGLNDYQLDHKFSILEGYKQHIDSEIISSLPNLELLSSHDNESKGCKCSITKEELLEAYNKVLNK